MYGIQIRDVCTHATLDAAHSVKIGGLILVLFVFELFDNFIFKQYQLSCFLSSLVFV